MTRQELFKKEFLELLKKHDVCIEVGEKDIGQETVCVGISFYSNSRYDLDGNVVSENIDFITGRWIDAESEI